jgi:hypothetical protein
MRDSDTSVPLQRAGSSARHGCGQSEPRRRAERAGARPQAGAQTRVQPPLPDLHTTGGTLGRHRNPGIWIIASRCCRWRRWLAALSGDLFAGKTGADHGPASALAAVIGLSEHAPLLLDGGEYRVLIDRPPAFLMQPLDRQPVLPERHRRPADIGIGHADHISPAACRPRHPQDGPKHHPGRAH